MTRPSGPLLPLASSGVIGIASDPDDDAVAVHGGSGIFCGNVNVALVGAFARDKSKAGLMDLDRSRHQIGRLWENVAIFADSTDLSGALKCNQRLGDCAPAFAFAAECLGQFLLAQAAGISVRASGRGFLFSVILAFHPPR